MIYLLHSTVKIGREGRNSAQHYIGYCEDSKLWQRLTAHATGSSKVAVLRAFQDAGADLLLVRLWPEGGQALERHLKNVGHYKGRCPICQGWLAPEHGVNINAVALLTRRYGGRRSELRISAGEQAPSIGTVASKLGLSLQTVIQAPGDYSGSVALATLAGPGGLASRVTALTRLPVGSFVGTKQPWSVGGKPDPFVPVTRGQPKLRSASKSDGGVSTTYGQRKLDLEGFET